MLAELMRMRSNIAIAGTHGKTTTTTMVATLLDKGGLDPTVINGGIIHAYGSNARAGAGEWMVVEADESDGSFNRLPATIAIVTNIDPEHMEHWGTIENLRKGFLDFVSNIPFYGLAVCCTDHPEVQALVGRVTDRRVVTFGFNAQADVRAARASNRAEIARHQQEIGETRMQLLTMREEQQEQVAGFDAAGTVAQCEHDYQYGAGQRRKPVGGAGTLVGDKHGDDGCRDRQYAEHDAAMGRGHRLHRQRHEERKTEDDAERADQQRSPRRARRRCAA